jgi:hypothetical protein
VIIIPPVPHFSSNEGQSAITVSGASVAPASWLGGTTSRNRSARASSVKPKEPVRGLA